MPIRVIGEGAAAREAVRLLASCEAPAEEVVLLETDDLRCARAASRRAARVVVISSRGPRVLNDSGRPFTLILSHRPYQDDLLLRETIERGRYPLPIGPRGMSRVDARDVAEAAVRALLEPGHEGRTYPLVGPEALTADEVARTWAHVLGRPVRPSDGRGPLADLYRSLPEPGLRARCEDFAVMDRILGRPPRPFGLFVRETVEAWAEKEKPRGR